jgi:sulfur carrier protein
MKLVVSGVSKEFNDGITVSELIIAEKVQTPMYVSVSVNDEFIKSDELDVTILQDNDVVEFLYFMGGGVR